MDTQVAIAVGTALAALAALAAVIVTVVVYKGQSALSARIANEQGALSAKIAKQQSEVSKKIHEQQALLSQRQLILPLWEYISSLDNIDPQAPKTPMILKVVNTLELVAITSEGGAVDKAVIKRTFQDSYLQLYDQVAAVQHVPGLNKSGMTLLRENPAAMKFYDELRQDHVNRGQLTPP